MDIIQIQSPQDSVQNPYLIRSTHIAEVLTQYTRYTSTIFQHCWNILSAYNVTLGLVILCTQLHYNPVHVPSLQNEVSSHQPLVSS